MKPSFLVMLILCLALAVQAKPKAARQTAVFHVQISCDNCVKRIQNYIPYEKGLKDMHINKEAQTVTLTWDPQKTDTATLKQAFEKIKKPVSLIEMPAPPVTGK